MQEQSFSYAEIWKRAVALAIDVAIVLNLFIYPIVIFSWRTANHLLKAHDLYRTNPGIFVLLAWIHMGVGFAIWIGYFSAFERSSWRATPGKMAVKIKVAYLEDDSFISAFLRNLIKLSPMIFFQSAGIYVGERIFLGGGKLPAEDTNLVSALSAGYAALIYAVALFNKKKQTFHDIVAKTVVVKTDDNPLKQLYLRTMKYLQYLRKANFPGEP